MIKLIQVDAIGLIEERLEDVIIRKESFYNKRYGQILYVYLLTVKLILFKVLNVVESYQYHFPYHKLRVFY